MPIVQLDTNMGAIVLELDRQHAPKTVDNFLQYVADGHYDGTIFHRVIPNFMIQAGGFAEGMNEKSTRAPIANEAANGLSNNTGTIAMARTNDPHSASAQFFINTKDNDFLNYQGPHNFGYAVFGKVIDGMDVVRKIEQVNTGKFGFHSDVPTTPVVINKASIVQK